MEAADIIRFPLITEKGSTYLNPQNKYQFAVLPQVSKTEVKKAIEKLYKVKVISVNVLSFKGKTRRYRAQLGKKPDWKKAIVTLKQGDHIEFV